MARRQYSNIAVDTTLNAGITAGDTSMVVASDVGWPSAPFVLVIEPDTVDEELVLVGAKAGTTFSSLTRGFGGTSAKTHAGGDVVKHVAVAEDYSFIWTHAHDGVDDSAPLPDHALNHRAAGSDALTGLSASQVTFIAEAVQEATFWDDPDISLTATHQDLATIVLPVPSWWNTWDVLVRGELEAWSTSGPNLELQLLLGGVQMSASFGGVRSFSTTQAPAVITAGLGGFTTTSTQIKLQGRIPGGTGTIFEDLIILHAIATRIT